MVLPRVTEKQPAKRAARLGHWARPGLPLQPPTPAFQTEATAGLRNQLQRDPNRNSRNSTCWVANPLAGQIKSKRTLETLTSVFLGPWHAKCRHIFRAEVDMELLGATCGLASNELNGWRLKIPATSSSDPPVGSCGERVPQSYRRSLRIVSGHSRLALSGASFLVQIFELTE